MRKALLLAVVVAAATLTPAAPAHAATDAQIKAAIARAVDYLKRNGPAGADAGQVALAGLAMLEAKVEPDDPAIQKMVEFIRRESVEQMKTYNLALAIMFLDRMGLDIDNELIQSMGVRLVLGQNSNGGWSYRCPEPTPDEVGRLKQGVETSLKGGTAGKMKPSEAAGSIPLSPALLQRLRNRPELGAMNAPGMEDNSNTQFAILGLWAARRHGVPAEIALQNTETRFRRTQQQGGWTYGATNAQLTGSMTCAGLLGLAIGIGNRGEKRILKGRQENKEDKSEGSKPAGGKKDAPPIPNPLDDPQVKAAFQFLGAFLNGAEPGRGAVGPGPNIGLGGPLGGGGGRPEHRKDLYLMWSMERVCMIYGVPKIGGLDWHHWGCDFLVPYQNRDGSYPGTYGAIPETSFALMFMCQANLARDLTDLFNRRLRSGPGDKMKKSEEKNPASASGDPKKPGSTPAVASQLDPADMSKALTEAKGPKQAELIKQYTESKGSAYTQALVDAIPQLDGDAKKAARDALAERMARMSASTLKEYLTNENPELRRGADYGIAMREEKELVPDLINALADKEDFVVRAVRVALRSLSDMKQDFGPAPGASDAQKQEAIAGWTAWWKKQSK